jgi:hypothetical protein
MADRFILAQGAVHFVRTPEQSLRAIAQRQLEDFSNLSRFEEVE